MARAPLPIDSLLPEIGASLAARRDLILEAAPGAGKTTRVPQELLRVLRGEVLVLEPRRIASRMAARRIAQELGERVGETAGYQVRFEDVTGPGTRLRFMTEGVFTRRLLSDPVLVGVDAVVLDEFHERHLETDAALALLRRLQSTRRPDLNVVIMSATLDSRRLAEALPGARLLCCAGREHSLSVRYTPYSAEPMEEQAAAAVERLAAEQPAGHILVFLPGAVEIRRTQRACEGAARRHGLSVTPLYGDLTPAEQDRAVSPGPQRKLILSTNIAESSITIEGVTAVIDSGLARKASDSAWTGLPLLELARISKSSAQQRAGRAGRIGPGIAIRLYTAEDFHRRPEHDPPEITRRELSGIVLALEAMGIDDPATLPWLDPPPPEAFVNAVELIRRLAPDRKLRKRMAALPLHPRLARMVLEAAERGAADEACRAAAILSSGARTRSGNLIDALEEEWDGRTRQTYQQLLRIVKTRSSSAAADVTLLESVLAGFPDRVARRKSGRQVLLSNGGSAVLAFDTQLEFFAALDIEERTDQSLPIVRLVSQVHPEWLLENAEERVRLEWNRTAERVEKVTAVVYDRLVIDEHRETARSGEGTELLIEKALEAGIGQFVDREALDRFLARAAWASGYMDMPALDAADALRELASGLRSFAELRAAAAGLIPFLEQKIPNRRRFDEIAPERIRLPGGRNARVQYSKEKPPWVESRLQDFFGLRETPRIANGRVPLVLHLLAPNGRPVQTTTDLAGFWERLYPQVRRELARRYPRHSWPEQPY